MKKARKHQEKRRNFLYRERESQNTTPLQQGYAAEESVYSIEITEQQKHIFTGMRSAERTRADQEEEHKEDHQRGRGAAGRQGVLTT